MSQLQVSCLWIIDSSSSVDLGNMLTGIQRDSNHCLPVQSLMALLTGLSSCMWSALMSTILIMKPKTKRCDQISVLNLFRIFPVCLTHSCCVSPSPFVASSSIAFHLHTVTDQANAVLQYQYPALWLVRAQQRNPKHPKRNYLTWL